MAPTSVLSSSPVSSWPSSGDTCHFSNKRAGTTRDLFDVTMQDFDNSCETYFCSGDVSPSPRSVIPEASDAFRLALGKMKDDEESLGYASLTSSLPSSQHRSCSKSTSLFVFERLSSPKLTSSTPSLKSSSSSFASSSHLRVPEPRRLVGNNDTKRPASFGGSDVVKPRPGRRASHCEKRVSWADERGTEHQLINVRLIRPRVAIETSTGVNRKPGQSILRRTGCK